MPDCSILRDSWVKMRTNFCLLWNPVGVISPLVKMDVSMPRHEKSLKHQQHYKNAAGKQHWFHSFSWAVSQLKLLMTACWWNMIYNVHRHMSKLLTLLEWLHRSESYWILCWVPVSKIKWSSWEYMWDSFSEQFESLYGRKEWGWKINQLSSKQGYVLPWFYDSPSGKK